MSEQELCTVCDSPTGRAGKHEDSFYAGDFGPYCEACWQDVPEKLAEQISAQAVKIEQLQEHIRNLTVGAMKNRKIISRRVGAMVPLTMTALKGQIIAANRAALSKEVE